MPSSPPLCRDELSPHVEEGAENARRKAEEEEEKDLDGEPRPSSYLSFRLILFLQQAGWPGEEGLSQEALTWN